jgi:serine/threonine-protein kinase
MPDTPTKIGRYNIVKLLGSGAMGKVYLAHDPVLGRNLALKTIAIDPRVQSQTREEYLARFAAEAKASARLDHPSIVQTYDAGQENGEPWIAFQVVDGESLEAILAVRGRLTIRRSILFTVDIASALQHAHGWNIIHRDVKPANILVESRTGIAKLADFGIAQAPWSAPVADGSMMGSPGYMSPEQIDGKEVDQRSDLFSLGIVLYQMVSGRHPFLRDTMNATIDATCRGGYKPLRDLVPEVPRQLDAAVRRCLFANIKMRMRTAAELVDILRPLAPDVVRDHAGRPKSFATTHVIVGSRASGTDQGKTALLGNVFYRLKIMRWYSAGLDAVRKRFAILMGRNELFTGEALEDAAGMFKTLLRRLERWAREIGERFRGKE